MAFDILDRITGDWTVVNATWMASFVQSMIKNTPALWFAISMFLWALVAFIGYKFFKHVNYQSQGLTTIRMKVDRMVFLDKLRLLLSTKRHSFEERDYDEALNVVKITYDELDAKAWGGCAPKVTLEFDEKNKILYTITLKYNRRAADKVRS